jgi:LysM repeat protein
MTGNHMNRSVIMNPSQVPTPATAMLTSTQKDDSGCQTSLHKVQEHENLDDIAQQFSISKEKIIELNKLESKSIEPGSWLLIHACESTPTGTVNPPAFTITPILQSITNTPG